MAFKKYNSSNNAYAAFNLPINDTDLTCVLKGRYDRFPLSNFIIKATKTVAWVVTARENIYVATRSGATCAGLIRAYEEVPIDDAATTNIQQALSFDADDVVECVISSEFLKDMQDNLASKEWVQNQENTYSADTGAANAYVITLDPAPTAYIAGQSFTFKAVNANSWASTINVNWLWVKSIKKNVSDTLVSWDIKAWQITTVTYDGTNFQVSSVIPASIDVDTFVLWEAVALWDAISVERIVPAMACDSTLSFGNASATQNRAVRLVGTGIAMTELSIWLLKVWTPADNCQIAIQADSAWSPSWVDIQIISIAGGTITTSVALYNQAISSITPTDKTPYWAVLKRSGALDGANYFWLACHTNDTVAFPYKTNNAWVWGSLTYTETPCIYGKWFYQKMAVRAKANIKKELSRVQLYAPSALSLYDSISKTIDDVYTAPSWLKSWRNYFLQDTVWAIWLTPWTTMSYAWTALPNWEIKIMKSTNGDYSESYTMSSWPWQPWTWSYEVDCPAWCRAVWSINSFNTQSYFEYNIWNGWVTVANVTATAASGDDVYPPWRVRITLIGSSGGGSVSWAISLKAYPFIEK